jgi:hypothetical protein
MTKHASHGGTISSWGKSRPLEWLLEYLLSVSRVAVMYACLQCGVQAGKMTAGGVYRGVAHPIVSIGLSRRSFQGLQRIGGITKVEMKVNLTTGCVTPLYEIMESPWWGKTVAGSMAISLACCYCKLSLQTWSSLYHLGKEEERKSAHIKSRQQMTCSSYILIRSV